MSSPAKTAGSLTTGKIQTGNPVLDAILDQQRLYIRELQDRVTGLENLILPHPVTSLVGAF